MKVAGMVNIKDGSIQIKSGKSGKGKDYRIAYQVGFIQTGDEIRRVEFPRDEANPLPPGRYQVSIDCVVGAFSQLEVGRNWEFVAAK